MIAVCPRCGSTDVHSSHTKGTADRILRLLAFPPRRCSACGWRGYRLRALYPSAHGSNPDVPVAKLPQPAPPPPPPEPAPGRKDAGKRKHQRHHSKSKNEAAWRIALLAVGLGAVLGYVVLAMGK